MLSCCKCLKEFWRIFCFFGHKHSYFICLITEADDFLFSFWGERTVVFMFYWDELSWYFRVASLRCRRISIFCGENFPSQFYSSRKKRSCLFFRLAKMLSCFNFFKEFLLVFCFFGQNPWHFVCLRTEADDFLFSFLGERTVGFMFYRDEMSWYFRVASQRGSGISIFPKTIFHHNFILHLKSGRVYISGEVWCCRFVNFWKIFDAFLAFFGHNAWHFVCLRTEADDFLFFFRGERTVGFMFYGDEMSWYFRVSSQRYRRIYIFAVRIFHYNFILRVKNVCVYIFGEAKCCRVVNFWKNFDAFSVFSDISFDILFNWEMKQTIFFSLFG
jgi:hypothetical protein